MATTISSTGITFGQYTSTTRPTGISQGHIIYNTDRKGLEIYDGSNWVALETDAPFLYRQIIAYGYVYGGYKSSSPWTNVNVMTHSTDACTDLGNLLQYAGAYVSGFCNRDNAFLFGCDGTWPGTSTQTSSFNMRNNTTLTASTNHNMTVARNDSGTAFKEHDFGYICGGGSSQIDVFNGSTETMYAATSGFTTGSYAGDSGYQYGCSTISDEHKSLVNLHPQFFKIDHPTATGSSCSTFAGTLANNGQQKGINSKVGKGWFGANGTYSGGYILNRWEFSTETNLGTVNKPMGNCGEENFDMGQAHQYCMGHYDGAQNNRTWKFYYNTESGTELTATASIRSGVPGGSSGHCAWRD